MIRLMLISLLLVMVFNASATAGVKSKAGQETAEYLLKKFGVECGEETVETLTTKLGKYSVKYGDEAMDAIRKTGPRGFKLVEDAGDNAPEVVKLLNKHGSKGVHIAADPSKLALFAKHGDDAAKAMIKHPGVAEPLTEKFGRPAAKALQAVSSQNARRIAMMADDGSLTAAGQADELIIIVSKYGDKAAEFIWKNKGALAVVAVAAAFIADPQPFIDGTKDLAEVAVKPIDSAAKEVGKGVAQGTNWTITIISIGILMVVLVVLKTWQPLKRWQRSRQMVSPKNHNGDR